MKEEQKQELEGTQAENTVVEERSSEAPDKKLTGKKLTGKQHGILIAAAAVIIALAVGIGIYNTPANCLSRQLDLGQKYLLEQNYEQAIVEFDKAIAIDSMNADAFMGKVEAYIGLKDYESALEVLEIGYERSVEGSEEREKLIDYYAELADIRLKNREYEECLLILDKVLESNRENSVLQAELGKCLNEYLDLLISQSHYEEVKQLIEKYKAIAIGVDLDVWLGKIEKIELTKKIEAGTNEINNYTTMCSYQLTAGKLSYQYLLDFCNEWVKLLEDNKDIWMEKEKCLVNYGQFLSKYYCAVNELDKCLEIRKQIYEKCIEKNLDFRYSDVFIPEEITRYTDDSGMRISFDAYGRQIRYCGESDGHDYEKGLYTEQITEFGENGRDSISAAEFRKVNGEVQKHVSTRKYDSEGRVIESMVEFTNGVSGNFVKGSSKTTYEYFENGYVEHCYSESTDNNGRGSISWDRDCALDEFGNVTYGDMYNVKED